MLAFGISESHARRALLATDGNLERAADWAFNHEGSSLPTWLDRSRFTRLTIVYVFQRSPRTPERRRLPWRSMTMRRASTSSSASHHTWDPTPTAATMYATSRRTAPGSSSTTRRYMSERECSRLRTRHSRNAMIDVGGALGEPTTWLGLLVLVPTSLDSKHIASTTATMLNKLTDLHTRQSDRDICCRSRKQHTLPPRNEQRSAHVHERARSRACCFVPVSHAHTHLLTHLLTHNPTRVLA